MSVLQDGKQRLTQKVYETGAGKLEAKEYLKSLKLLDTRIEQRTKQLDDIEHRRSDVFASFERGSEMIEATKAEICGEILQFERQRNEIIGKIQRLDNNKFVRVLHKRYVEYKPFEQIAAELGFARSHTLFLHRKALEALQALI